MYSRAKRRKDKYRIIRKRKKLLASIKNIDGIVSGKFANNNIANRIVRGGRTIKTNARNAQQTYRHHGLYGIAKVYNPHDQRQIDDMIFQEKEYYEQSD